ncbi:MAG: urease accessory protein, partial [Burkholderiales bacterium]
MGCMNQVPRSRETTASEDGSQWHAALTLCFQSAAGATRITERAHSGPLRLLKPLYPEGDRNCHAVIVHPPGGIVAGDALVTKVRVESAAHAVLTTPGAQKWYRSTSSGASADTTLRVESEAALEWLPQEAIVFDGAVAKQNISIDLGSTAKFFGWEMVCFGRRAHEESFRRGSFAQDIRIVRGDSLLWQETARLKGADPLFGSPVGWGGQTVSATAWLAAGHSDAARGANDQALLVAIREALGVEIKSGASNP